MTAYLPPNLLALFAPRDPIPFMPPLDKLPHEKKLQSYIGVSQFMSDFEDPKDTPPPTRVETKDERKERKRKERQEQQAYKLEQELAMWNPGNDPVWTSDPFKTLFITRINYDTSESKLRREFEVFGPVRKINLAHNQKTGKPRGYAFIEYEHERDMHSAYKHADGKKIDGRRVLVDVERSRTVKGWRPRRLGGGLGGTRKGGPDVNTKYSGRDDMGMRDDRDDDDRGRSPERRRRRSRSRSRERPVRPRRSRSPRPERRRRSRSRERRRSRERPPPAEDDNVTVIEGGEEERPKRSRSQERKRRRSRSRERTRRSRSPRDRKRRRSRSRDRSRRSSRERKPDIGALGEGEVPPEESEDGSVKVEKVEKLDPNADQYAEGEQPEMFQNAMFTNEYPEEMENNYEYEKEQAVNGQ